MTNLEEQLTKENKELRSHLKSLVEVNKVINAMVGKLLNEVAECIKELEKLKNGNEHI